MKETQLLRPTGLSDSAEMGARRFEGKGTGSLLVDRLLQKVDAASLSCDPTNPALRLYVRLGFASLADGRTMLRVKSARD
jgi:hypothetical protein